MNPDVKEEIKTILLGLRSTCIRNGVSIAFDKREEKLIFFDTFKYLQDNTMTGFTVKLNDLVK